MGANGARWLQFALGFQVRDPVHSMLRVLRATPAPARPTPALPRKRGREITHSGYWQASQLSGFSSEHATASAGV